MRRDRVRRPAAYLDAGWMLRAGASRRVERPDTQRKRSWQAGVRCRPSQESPYYVGQPIPQPNSSSADPMGFTSRAGRSRDRGRG